MEIKMENSININSEIVVFILWENARAKEELILNEINSKFNILKKYEITWTVDKFLDNLSSFYSDDVTNNPYQAKMRGTGPFLMVLCEDLHPNYGKQETNHGDVIVNLNALNFKKYIRSNILGGGYVFHASDNYAEAKHDVVLLTGKSIKDIIESENLDGKTIKLVQDLPCVSGWENMAQVFYVLNEACNYVVLWGAEDLPNNFISHKINGDIDILTDNLQRLIAILKTNNKLKTNAFVFYNWITVGGEQNLFHAKFIGDDYFDRKWQYRQLESRVLNKNGIFVLDDINQFYSLLYHGLIHKVNYQKYLLIFNNIAKRNNLYFHDDIELLKNMLHDWMKFHKYKYTTHLDHGVLHKENVINKRMLKKQKDFYIFQNKWGTSIFEKELIALNPELATTLALRFAPFIELETRRINLKNKKYSIFKKDLDKNTLFLTYTKRFGRIGRTKLYKNRNKLYIKKDFVGFSQYVKSKYLKVNGYEKPRIFENCKTFYQVLSENVANEQKFKELLEIYVQIVFKKFKNKTNNNLSGKAFDMLPQNCLIINFDKHEFKFFDFEYELLQDMDKSYMVYRCVKHLYFNIDKKNLYEYLCKKFNLPDTWFWCESFDKPINIFSNIEKAPLFFQANKIKIMLAKILTFLILKKSLRQKMRNKIVKILTPEETEFEKYFKIYD